MILRLALLFLLVTNIHGGPVPPLSEFIAVNHGAPVDFKMFDTISAATAANFLLSGINVFLILWIPFLLPPSCVESRLAMLSTSLVVEISIIANSFTNASTSEEMIKVRVPVLPVCFKSNVLSLVLTCFQYVTQLIGHYLRVVTEGCVVN